MPASPDRPTGVVLDASAFFDSLREDRPDWGEAVEYLLSTYPARAPALLASEAGNVIHRAKASAFGDSLAERADGREALLIGVALRPSTPDHRAAAAELAERHELTFYDAEYLAVALEEPGTLLVTHDEALLKAAKRRLPGRAMDLDAVVKAIRAGDL